MDVKFLNIKESTLNNIGYQEFMKGNAPLTLSIFKINAILYPESASVYNSLGEYYMEVGNNKQALTNFKKSIELNPNNENAKKMIAKLLKK